MIYNEALVIYVQVSVTSSSKQNYSFAQSCDSEKKKSCRSKVIDQNHRYFVKCLQVRDVSLSMTLGSVPQSVSK